MGPSPRRVEDPDPGESPPSVMIAAPRSISPNDIPRARCCCCWRFSVEGVRSIDSSDPPGCQFVCFFARQLAALCCCLCCLRDGTPPSPPPPPPPAPATACGCCTGMPCWGWKAAGNLCIPALPPPTSSLVRKLGPWPGMGNSDPRKSCSCAPAQGSLLLTRPSDPDHGSLLLSCRRPSEPDHWSVPLEPLIASPPCPRSAAGSIKSACPPDLVL
mmetsp:Transcript_69794/g.221065  ORF Transcript_69794/g.221065 Transcript_69794/m.221065 type:complete len:215 (+) Transcript_69794:1406-2050(+)